MPSWISAEWTTLALTALGWIAYLWGQTKFEVKKTKAELEKESEALEKLVKTHINLASIASVDAEDKRIAAKVTAMLNDHILEGAQARAAEILAIGGNSFVLRTTHHDAMGDLDAKLQRILLDQAAQGAAQAAQGADIRNLKDQLSALATLVGQTNVELRGIGTDVAKIAGIWTEHVRQHGGLSLSNPQQRSQ